MRKNPMATPAKAKGTPNQGNGAPLVNMPANNVGTFPVKVASGQSSKFGSGVNQKAGQSGVNQSSKGGKANMPANNKTDKMVKIGHTKHGVGQVPGYLRGQ